MALSASSAPDVKFTFPPASLLGFPPSSQPEALSPPTSDFTFARPFNIDPTLYNELLKVQYPVTIAIIYITVVFFLNRLNKQRQNQRWAISETRAFFAFVILHNVLLAIYSGWTFLGMVNGVKNVWPGWDQEHGLVKVVDAFCKMSGPRGLGSAAYYKPETESWNVSNHAIKLLDGKPDSTDVGRLWNEGLAFYGWLFYLSKFYEVVDSLIIIAKGKRSSFLQTYHHAGAMFCTWAGIRYMSPPIWMFVTFNSGIHTLMYTYYTLAALSVQIPTFFKRTLTTLQIAQFVVGASYALGHLFVAYRLPVQTPYLFIHNLSTVLPSVTSSIAATATVAAGMTDWARKMAFRAIGDEALAENVLNREGETFGSDAVRAADVERANTETRYRLESTTVNCIDTSGEAFAIYLNVMYLAPLTFLFIRFFIRSYLRRSSDSTSGKPHQKNLSKSSVDAAKGVKTEILKAMARDRGSEFSSVSNSDSEPSITIPANLKKKIDGAMDRLDKTSTTISERTSKAISSTKETTSNTVTSTSRTASNAAKQTAQTAKEVVENGAASSAAMATAAKEAVQDAAANPSGTAADAADVVKNSASEARKLVERAYAAASRVSGNDSDERDVRDEGFFDGASNDGEGEERNMDGPSKETKEMDGKVKKEESGEPERQGEKGVEDSGVLVGREDEKEDAEGRGDGGERDDEKQEEDKKEDGGEGEEKEDSEGNDVRKKEEDGEVKAEQAYEASVDDVTTSEQRKAEKEMQPPGVQNSA